MVLRGGKEVVAWPRVSSAMVSSTVDLDARRPEVEASIDEALGNCITESFLNDAIPSLGPKIRGKVGGCLFFLPLAQLSLSRASILIP